jgi:hypothetical protein
MPSRTIASTSRGCNIAIASGIFNIWPSRFYRRFLPPRPADDLSLRLRLHSARVRDRCPLCAPIRGIGRAERSRQAHLSDENADKALAMIDQALGIEVAERSILTRWVHRTPTFTVVSIGGPFVRAWSFSTTGRHRTRRCSSGADRNLDQIRSSGRNGRLESWRDVRCPIDSLGGDAH